MEMKNQTMLIIYLATECAWRILGVSTLLRLTKCGLARAGEVSHHTAIFTELPPLYVQVGEMPDCGAVLGLAERGGAGRCSGLIEVREAYHIARPWTDGVAVGAKARFCNHLTVMSLLFVA